MDKECPWAHIYASRTFLAMDDIDEALRHLDASLRVDAVSLRSPTLQPRADGAAQRLCVLLC
jgi:hypothetical protein